MRKFTFFLIMSGTIALTMNSCVKEYTCQCQISFYGKPGLPEPQVREYGLSNTLKKAQQECSDRSRTYEMDGIITEEKCELY